MSIVPKEVTSGFIEDWHKGVAAGTALELPEYIANRAAQWALEEAVQLCNDSLPREAIEAAIKVMQAEADAVQAIHGHWPVAPLLKHIKQLQALLPNE